MFFCTKVALSRIALHLNHSLAELQETHGPRDPDSQRACDAGPTGTPHARQRKRTKRIKMKYSNEKIQMQGQCNQTQPNTNGLNT
jgi:hypothetical protein